MVVRSIQILMIWWLGVVSVHAQTPTPGQKTDQKILIRYATAHIGNGEKIDNAYLAIQGGEIIMLADGNKTRISTLDYDTIIDAEGHHIYPGFIVMDSRLGLTEIDQVRATHDFDETGDFTPNVRALPAFNTESKVVATVRTNGVLMAQIAPKGGRVSGMSSCVHFDGWNWKDAAVRADEGIYMNWPSRSKYTGWWAEPGISKENKNYSDQRDELISFFQEARAYAQDSLHKEQNLRFEATRGLFDGSKTLYIRANWAKDILDAVMFFRASGVQSCAIVGGAEAVLVSTELRENNIAVVIDRVHKLPVHDDEPVNNPFELAANLSEAGVTVAIASSGSMEAMLSRNLPFQLGTAVHYGLDYEKAIEAVTLTPAKLMGIDKNYGTIESGKRATFFISSGDALDMATNDIWLVFVEGRTMELWNHQTKLFEKFSKK